MKISESRQGSRLREVDLQTLECAPRERTFGLPFVACVTGTSRGMDRHEGSGLEFETGSGSLNDSEDRESEANGKFVKIWSDWLLNGCVFGGLFLVSLWLSVALIRDYVHLRNDTHQKKEKRWINKLTIFCSVTYCVFTLAKIFEEIVVDLLMPELCAVSKSVIIGFSGLSIGLSYSALWMRQRCLYNEPSMSPFTSPCLRVLSWLSGGLCFIYPVFNFALYIGASTPGMRPSGCSIVKSSLRRITPWIIRAVTTVLIHSTLLWPFVYPLRRYSSKRKVNGVDLQPVIIRALVVTAVCAISDIGVYTLCAVSAIRSGEAIGIVTQFNQIINLMMIIVAFPEWKKTVFPFCR